MSQMMCCVPGCVVTIKDGVLHRFPSPGKDADRFAAWITSIGGVIMEMDSTYIYNNKRVCRRHFEEIHCYPSNRLSKLAVPKLFMTAVPQTTEIDVQPSTSMSSQFLQDNTHKSCAVPQTMEVDPVVLPSTSTSSEFYPQKYMTDTRISPGLVAAYGMLVKEVRQLKKIARQNLSKKHRAIKIQKAPEFKTLTKNMPKAARIFFKMQIMQSGKTARARRFTLDEKILALSLFKPAPKAYQLLKSFCALPSRSTLRNLLSKIELNTGINEKLFKHLKKRVDKIPNCYKYCTLVFDEMAIGPSINYDVKNDQIVGLVDDGTERQPKFCDHVLVFMIRGILKKLSSQLLIPFAREVQKPLI